MLDEDQVRRIAHLARLEIGPREVERYALELSRVLDYVERISQADLADHPAAGPEGAPALRLREDRVEPGLDPEEGLAAAPEAAHGLFRVPSVLPTQREPKGSG